MTVNTEAAKGLIKQRKATQVANADNNIQGVLTRELNNQFKAIKSLVPKHISCKLLFFSKINFKAFTILFNG